MKKITAILIGAGQRGMYAYAPYALRNPHELEFIAVAEPDTERRQKFKALHNIDDGKCGITPINSRARTSNNFYLFNSVKRKMEAQLIC